MFEHIKHIKQRESLERMWAIRISSHPHAGKDFQRSNLDEIRNAGEVGNSKKRKSPFEMATNDEMRLRMIGGEIRAQGDRWDDWVISHPRQMRWLKESGKTLDDARTAFDEWFERQLDEDEDAEDCDEAEVGIGIGGVGGVTPTDNEQ